MFFILKVKYVCMIDCVYQANIYIEISTRKGLNIWDNELSHSEALKTISLLFDILTILSNSNKFIVSSFGKLFSEDFVMIFHFNINILILIKGNYFFKISYSDNSHLIFSKTQTPNFYIPHFPTIWYIINLIKF